ncbi:MAG: hypothetical protein K2Q45_05400 [Nitrosomonas sp.]|nr:hypothetical protein [Nitrosomonas sp.]
MQEGGGIVISLSKEQSEVDYFFKKMVPLLVGHSGKIDIIVPVAGSLATILSTVTKLDGSPFFSFVCNRDNSFIFSFVN